MIPLGDSEKLKRTPFINITLIIVNVAIFLFLVFLAHDPQKLITLFGFIPERFFDTGWNPLVYWKKYLPLFTAHFLHGGWLHIVGNMLFLFTFGDNIEDRLGHLRYFLFYTACGIISLLGYSYGHTHSTVVVIGASGAIAGIMGAFYILFPQAKVKSFFLFKTLDIPAIYYLFFWFVLNLVQALFPGIGGRFPQQVALGAHISGFIAGALLINLFLLGAPTVKAKVKVKTGKKPAATA